MRTDGAPGRASGVSVIDSGWPTPAAEVVLRSHEAAIKARVKAAVRDLERLPSLADLMDALVAEDSASPGPASPRRDGALGAGDPAMSE